MSANSETIRTRRSEMLIYDMPVQSRCQGRAMFREKRASQCYSPCPLPQTDTSSPISRNIAALVASARLAASASGA